MFERIEFKDEFSYFMIISNFFRNNNSKAAYRYYEMMK
jgi:pentatricopeptide repeat protein